MKLPPQTLKQILLDSGFVTETDFDNALRTAQSLDKPIEDILYFRGIITEDALGKFVANYLKVGFANITSKDIPDEVLSLVPEKVARSFRLVPFELSGNTLSVAMESPNDFEALEFARRQTGLQIVPYYASSSDIRRALGQYKRNIKKDFSAQIEENVRKATPSGTDPTRAAEELPVVKILDTIFEYAIAERASDIHIETQSSDVIVRFRVDGILRDIARLPKGIEIALVARVKILSKLRIDERRVPQDGRYKFKLDNDIVALRISIIPGFFGENVVMRLLPETSRPLSLEELGVMGRGLALLRENITKPNGMILVTGPTGSGKTTTLYSVLNILNTPDVKICTIEDPVEYGIARVTQIQVNNKAGMKFSNGLRALLRHDPDIIMVGEIRDQETAEIAVQSALTGHLVLSTLHTNDAAGALPRLLEMGVEGYLVASTVNIVVAQRLVRKICTGCTTKYKPSEAEINKYEAALGVKLDKQKFYKGAGCEICGGKGLKGRIGVYEILPVTEKMGELIAKQAPSDQITKLAVEEGMTTMVVDGLNKIEAGLTTIDEVVRAVRDE